MSATGHCLCGAVSVAAQGEPIFTGKCYCTDCQRGSGGGHSTILAYPQAAVAVAGPLATYTSKGDSGADVTRAFCPTCGARIYSAPAALPGMTLLAAGVMDDASRVKPTMSIFTKSAAPWDQPPSSIPSFPGMPPAGG